MSRESKLSNPDIFRHVQEKFLEHQWSPEQISGRLKVENSDISISYSTIYRGIYAGVFDTLEQRKSYGNRGAARKLRHRGKTRHTKNHIENRGKTAISNKLSSRPAKAEKRGRIGDWEGDTAAGINSGQCLMTLVDRKNRLLLSRKSDRKSAACVRDAMITLLKGQPLHSITPDSGKEFSYHTQVTQTLNGVQFYFPEPHQPWMRGTNENTGGLLREYFPIGAYLPKFSDAYIQSKVDELNKRPASFWSILPPYEVYFLKSLHLT